MITITNNNRVILEIMTSTKLLQYHATKKPYIRSDHINSWLLEILFCDATTDLIMNTLPKQIETACTRGPRYAGSIESAELE